MVNTASIPVAGPAEDELPAPSFPPKLVEELLRDISRAVKTLGLYLPNNPIYQKAIETLRKAFTPVWRQTQELVLTVTEAEIKWEGRVVMHEANRSESLPWVFYKDGIRELTLTQGVENEEIVALMEIMRRVKNAAPEEDDLLTLLWEQEFVHLRYRFVDVSYDSAPAIEASENATAERVLPLVEVKREIEEVPPEPEARKKAGLVEHG